MNIRGIIVGIASIAFVLQAGCASAPVEPVVALETRDPHPTVWHAEEIQRIDLGPVIIRDLNLFAPTIVDLGPAEIHLPGSQPVRGRYLRHANLVPTDGSGSLEDQIAWYEANAVRVDNIPEVYFGAGSSVNDLDSRRQLLEKSLFRIPDTDPTPTP